LSLQIQYQAAQDTDLLDNEDEGTMILRNVGKYSPVNMA